MSVYNATPLRTTSVAASVLYVYLQPNLVHRSVDCLIWQFSSFCLRHLSDCFFIG